MMFELIYFDFGLVKRFAVYKILYHKLIRVIASW